MARIRYIKPDFFKDDDLAHLPFETRLFFAGLWGMADKAGRLEDRPARLKAEIFPYDAVDVEKCLKQLAVNKANSGQPFINRYATDGQRYIQIVNWDKHQKPHHTERESKIPPAPPLVKEKGTEKGKENQLKASTELSNGEGTVKEPLNGRFAPPSPQDVCQYGESIGYNIDGQQFCDFYKSKGWMIGKNKMKDWEAAVRTWQKRDKESRGETIDEQMDRIMREEAEKKRSKI